MKAATMQVAMAMIPPRRLSGKTPKVRIARPARMAILTKIKAMGSPSLRGLPASDYTNARNVSLNADLPALFGRAIAPERPGFHDTFVLARRAGGIAAVRQGLFPGVPGVVRHRPAESRRPRIGIDRFSHALVLEGGYDFAQGFRGARGAR